MIVAVVTAGVFFLAIVLERDDTTKDIGFWVTVAIVIAIVMALSARFRRGGGIGATGSGQ